mmetsp:Transcript_3470/g.5414  ORF Transcript_3470/g.5414 Transcript_3470/m.5414 type:complete len:329 (-) Transcript_3470:89-1075(-)
MKITTVSRWISLLALTLLVVTDNQNKAYAFRHDVRPTRPTMKISTITTLRPRYSSKSMLSMVEGDTDMAVSVEQDMREKKIPIGSVPDFAISNDSNTVTATQKAWVYSHFLISFISFIQALWQINHTGSGEVDMIAMSMVFIASIILGDFGTGVFHWSVDNYGSINTPVVGTVCAAFQGHHQTPWTITFRPFINNVYKIAYGTVPALLLTVWNSSDHPYAQIFFTLFINWWLISQELHKYSHMRQLPAVVQLLQRMGVILSKKEHGLHHNSPFEGHYCILTGVCNPVLDRTKFFRHLEKLVFKLTGNKPLTWLEDPAMEKEAMSTTLF